MSRNHPYLVCLCAASATLAPGLARADGDGEAPGSAPPASAPAPAPRGEVIVIEDGGPRGGVGDLVGDAAAARDRRAALADTGFVTRIHVDERAGEAATLADVIGASVGAQVRSLGGLGAFASLSVRGASSGQTTVVVDGVPLSRVASVTTDLGRFELDGLDELTLHRGAVPIELGGAALGGALALHTRLGRGATGERLWLSAGVGSFGARHLRARWGEGDPDDGVATTVALGYAGADGDFTYFDDHGTNLVAEDDTYARRANNAFDHVDGAVRAGARDGAVAWTAGARGLWRAQGLPGRAPTPSLRAQLDTASALVDGMVEVAEAAGVAGATARAQAWGLIEAQRYADLDGEVGVGTQDRRYRTLSGGAAAAASWARGRHVAALGLDGRVDRFRDHDALRGDARVHGTRHAAGVALGDDVAVLGGRWVIAPAVRLDVLRTDPILDLDDLDAAPPPARTDVAPSPRVSTRALLTADVAIKASAGYYFRAPTLAELYGDRGHLVGSPDLLAERGPSADAGVVVAPARRFGPIDRVMVELAAFASWPHDTIGFVVTGARVARARNLGDAELRGVEVAAAARLARTVTLTANYTHLDTRQRTTQASFAGKQLPLRPRHDAYLRVDVARAVRGRVVAGWADVTYVAGNFLDQAELDPVPARHLVGAGVRAELGRGVLVGIEVQNALDHRVEQVALDPAPRPDLAEVPRAVADIAGFPLPGRALYVAVEWRR